MTDNDRTLGNVQHVEDKEDGTQALILTDEPLPDEDDAITLKRKQITLTMNRLAANLTELMDGMRHLSLTQRELNDKMDAMEKTIRLHTPVTPKQVRFFNAAIREAGRKLLQKRGAEGDRKANTILGNTIRKDVLRRYGVAALHEIPRHEYPVVLSQIATWNDAIKVRDAIKKARGEDA